MYKEANLPFHRKRWRAPGGKRTARELHLPLPRAEDGVGQHPHLQPVVVRPRRIYNHGNNRGQLTELDVNWFKHISTPRLLCSVCSLLAIIQGCCDALLNKTNIKNVHRAAWSIKCIKESLQEILQHKDVLYSLPQITVCYLHGYLITWLSQVSVSRLSNNAVDDNTNWVFAEIFVL